MPFRPSSACFLTISAACGFKIGLMIIADKLEDVAGPVGAARLIDQRRRTGCQRFEAGNRMVPDAGKIGDRWGRFAGCSCRQAQRSVPLFVRRRASQPLPTRLPPPKGNYGAASSYFPPLHQPADASGDVIARGAQYAVASPRAVMSVFEIERRNDVRCNAPVLMRPWGSGHVGEFECDPKLTLTRHKSGVSWCSATAMSSLPKRYADVSFG